MSLRDFVVYAGVCGGVLTLSRELVWRARWAVHRLRPPPPRPPPPPFQLPREIPRLAYVRHEIACLSCGKRLPQYELDDGLAIAEPARQRPCGGEKASAPS